MFVGRVNELQMLQSQYEGEGGKLVVLYGRRRIGKTELLNHFCADKEHVFYSCTECADRSQLNAFSKRLLRADHPAAQYIQSFANWEAAFEAVTQTRGRGKKLLVIDEFPYMVRGNAEIPSLLQKLWDTRLRHENVMIVLCGSAMSFIEKEILSEKNPLYGRATCVLKLGEMDYLEAAQFFPSYSAEDKIRAYAILGGIPHYLKQFSDQKPLIENVRDQILTKGSVLYSEVELMMRQEFRETAIYNTVLNAIALGGTQLNEIYQKTQIEKNKLSVYLKNLMEVGLVVREFSMAERLKEQGNIQRGLYRLSDSFFRFWYTYVFPYVPELDAGDADGICTHVVEPTLDQFVSRPFEEICIQYLRRRNRENTLPFHFVLIGRWWTKTDELDVVATEPTRTKYLIGECKYKGKPMERADMERAMAKFPLEAEQEAHYVFFSRSGYTSSAQQLGSEKQAMLIDLEKIFA